MDTSCCHFGNVTTKGFYNISLQQNEWCFYCRKLNVTINSIDTSATNWNATFCPVRRFNRTHWLFYCSRYLFPHRRTIRHILWPVNTIAFKHILRFRLLCIDALISRISAPNRTQFYLLSTSLTSHLYLTFSAVSRTGSDTVDYPPGHCWFVIIIIK